MATFIKAGLWSEKVKGYLGEFNLTKYIQDLISETSSGVTSVNTLTGAVELTTDNIPEVTDKNYVTDAEKVLINTQVVSESDYLSVINGYTVSGQDYTFLSGWEWVINGVLGYTNVGNVLINFPLTAPTYSRVDAVVATEDNTFIRISGTPSISTPDSPAIPTNTVFVLYVDVNENTVAVQPGPPGKNQVSNQPYDATSWNGENTIAPSKNAIRDKFESLSTNFIPLTGTTIGNPISGDMVININGYNSKLGYNSLNDQISLFNSNYTQSVDASGFVQTGINGLKQGMLDYDRGFVSNVDFSPNITDFDYTQKIYVDTSIEAISHSVLIAQFVLTYSGSYSMTTQFNDFPGTWSVTTDAPNKRLVFTNSLGASWSGTSTIDVVVYTQSASYALGFFQGTVVGGGGDAGKIYVYLVNTSDVFMTGLSGLRINLLKITV